MTLHLISLPVALGLLAFEGLTAGKALAASAAPAPKEREIVAQRGLKHKIFEVDGGRHKLVNSITPMHYRDARGAWREIDLRIQPSRKPGWDFEATKNNFAARFSASALAGELVRIEGGERGLRYWMGMRPAMMRWVDATGVGDIPARPRGRGFARGNSMVYPGIYGAGIDLSLDVTPWGVSKRITLTSLGSLGPIPRQIAAGQDPVLEFLFEIMPSANLGLSTERGAWDGHSALLSTGALRLGDGAVGFTMQSPVAFGPEPGQQTPVEYLVSKAGRGYLLRLRLPWSYLKTAAYPLTVDPTWGPASIAADNDDNGSCSDPGTGCGTANQYVEGTTNMFICECAAIDPTVREAWFRWAVNLPAVQVLAGTKIRIIASGVWGTGANDYIFKRVNETNCGNFAADTAARAVTATNQVAFVGNDFTADGQIQDIGFTAMLQDQFNLGGWASGNYFGVRLEKDVAGANDGFELREFSNAGGGGAELTIVYNQYPTAPTGLLTNDLTNPEVNTPTPYFSAVYNDPDAADIANNRQIQVDEELQFPSSPIWDNTAAIANCSQGARCASITYAGSDLSWGQTYRWRIRYRDDDGGWGAWSTSASSFTLKLLPPNTPSITAPADNSAEVALNPTLNSSAYSGEGSHTLSDWEVYDDSGLGAGNLVWSKYDDAANKTSIAVNTANGTFTNSLAGQTRLRTSRYYWCRARHANAAGVSAWSAANRFHTAGGVLLRDKSTLQGGTKVQP